MKLKKILLSAAIAACLSLCFCTNALAADLEDSRFKDKTWEQVFEAFLAAHNTDASQVTAGYYNTVTGEEHYHNKDTLMYGASMAKLPTNMLYAERISNGEMEWSTKVRGVPYQNIQYLSLVNSDNPSMDKMVQDLGGGSYIEFRKKILPYIGVEEGAATEDFLSRNFFTPEQIMYSLKLLYGNAEKYPGVENCMLLASPYDYFKQNQPPFVIAHKYGWYTDRGTTYLNDSAIVYTHDPILLVMFTANADNARQLLADYCSLMCDYAQYHRTLRYANDANEQAELSVAETMEFISVNTPASIPTEYPTWQYAVVGSGCVVLIVALIVLFRKKLIALLLILLALALIVIGSGPTELAFLALRDNVAEQIVGDFETAFRSDSRGMEFLTHCDSAMAHSEGTDMQSIVTKNIVESFDLRIGTAVRAGNSITVPVTVTKVDLNALNADLQTTWQPILAELLKEIDLIELYDDTGAFLPDTLNLALQTAFDRVMDNWDNYLYTEYSALHLTLSLEDSIKAMDPVWKILPDKDFLHIVNYT